MLVTSLSQLRSESCNKMSPCPLRIPGRQRFISQLRSSLSRESELSTTFLSIEKCSTFKSSDPPDRERTKEEIILGPMNEA